MSEYLNDLKNGKVKEKKITSYLSPITMDEFFWYMICCGDFGTPNLQKWAKQSFTGNSLDLLAVKFFW